MAIPQDEIIKLHPLAAYEGGAKCKRRRRLMAPSNKQ
jgi:hypothetical protein